MKALRATYFEVLSKVLSKMREQISKKRDSVFVCLFVSEMLQNYCFDLSLINPANFHPV